MSVCLASPPAFASGASPDRVTQLFDLIGLSAVIENTQDNIGALAESGSLPPGPLSEWWGAAADQHFKPAVLKAAYVSGTAELMEDAEVEELITLFSSDFLLHISGLETAQQTGFGREERKAQGDRILAELADSNPDRVAQYHRMLEVMDTVDDAVFQTQKISFVVIRTLALQATGGAPPDDTAILAMLAGQADEWRGSIAEEMLALSAQTYGDLDDAAFRRYMDILETPLVKGMYDKVGVAADRIIVEEFEGFAATLARLAGAQKL